MARIRDFYHNVITPFAAGLAILLLAVALAFGMLGCQSVTDTYLDADEATLQYVAPKWEQYIANDASLNPMQRADRRTVIATWRLRIEAHRREHRHQNR